MNKIKLNYYDSLGYHKISMFLKNYLNENTVIICIGTDRCIGDCLGPFVGTFLKDKFFPLPVYGTISEPIHALNIDEKLFEINRIHHNPHIVGIDACLGDEKSIGEIQVRDFPIHPGKGVGKSLPLVGEISIIGIVDSSSTNEVFTNRNIRLDFIIKMAKVISAGIIDAYCLYEDKQKAGD